MFPVTCYSCARSLSLLLSVCVDDVAVCLAEVESVLCVSLSLSCLSHSLSASGFPLFSALLPFFFICCLPVCFDSEPPLFSCAPFFYLSTRSPVVIAASHSPPPPPPRPLPTCLVPHIKRQRATPLALTVPLILGPLRSSLASH